jgi:diguanylate cyclase (GGDEF)-like protein/PAS domain S-box-containing protein
MKRKIIFSLFSLIILFSTGTVIATVVINNTTEKIRQLVSLHQVADIRQHLIMNIQTVQSDLYTVNTALGHTLDSTVQTMSALQGTSRKCLSCHHSPDIYLRLQNLQETVKAYQNALSYYITSSANPERKDKIKFEAASLGNSLLADTENMAMQAGYKLSRMTDASMAKMNQVKTVLYLTIAFTFLVGIFIAARLTIFITRPTEALAHAARAITTGELGLIIPYKDKTEFGELADAFNTMSSSLKTGYESLQKEISERKEAEEAVGKSENFLNTIFNSIHDPFCIIDKDYRIIRANSAYTELISKPIEDVINRNCFEVVAGKTTVCDQCVVEKTFRSAHPCAKDKLLIRSDGQKIWAEIYTYPIFNETGAVSHVIEYTRDITERKMAEEALKESKERYELSASGANDGLWDWDLISHTIYFSPRWKSMLGYKDGHVKGTPEGWFELIHPEDIGQFKVQVAAHINGHTPHLESEYRILHRDKSYRWVLSRGLAVRDKAGRAYRMAGSQTDITDRKAIEQQLLHDAFHDALTGLPNRALFMDRLQHVLKSSGRRREYLYAVLFLDLDRFKVINDSLGHLIGDQLLVTVGERLVQCLRPGDTVARLGGDEFALLVEDIKDINEIIQIAERIQKALSLPVMVGSQQVFISASIGIAVSSSNYEKPEHILRDADIAMYQAKAQGKACHEIFDPAMYESTLERLNMETDLRRAVDHGELNICYQPILDLDADRIVGFEALVRWLHPKRGVVYPLEFIPLAEETGLIFPIGEWVLREACSQVCAWQKQFSLNPPLKLSVNISSKQLSQPDLITKISEILDETGLDASCLALEITESMIMKDPDAAASIMKRMRDLGIHIHIDDFGTGYSSLSYIHRFPISALKIDRSFIQKMFANNENMEIIKAIITLANNLGLDLIAEGLEVSDQLAQLRELNCHYGQGFLFSEPMEVRTIEDWLASGRLNFDRK